MNSLKIIIVVCGLLLAVTTEQSQAVNLSDDGCPNNIKLLKNATTEQLHGSSNTSKEPLFLSEHYCFVLYTQIPGQGAKSANLHLIDKKYWLSKAEGKNIRKSYHKVYSSLFSREQRLNFVHFFMQKLTRKYIATPDAADERRSKILIAVDISPEHHLLLMHSLTRDMGNLEALHKLQQLQQNPPKAEDYPALSKLVDAVLDPKAVISDDKISELSSML